MIPLLLARMLVLGASAPKIGTLVNDDAFVLIGNRWQKASFSDKRKLQAETQLPSHPTGKYRLVPTVQKNEMGEMRAFSVVARRGAIVAGALEVIGKNMAGLRGDVECLGWGPSGESIVLQRSNSWSAHGTAYEICSLSLKTRRANPRVEIACTPAVSFILGEKAVVDASEDYEGADHPHLYRKTKGHAPIPVRFVRHTVCEASLELSPDGRWALVCDEPLKEFPRYQNGARWLLIDVEKGTLRALPTHDTDYHGLHFVL